ncbi:D-alanyl-D-alanine carboxypeptidase/D-alanyl-D-alanine-endopeptidase [Legionella jordanis]|uniref:D-alanyl-D-alanine carboxypeptidase/D-alanyl-D-alanine endopeptidase n=1 Tax=Legionella jordanis TaxID=456 RepID=UPI000EFE5AD6|nr:D-alanyl-D-alanine carboxypeptidase/D-alanyl-D-alanine-endopeptidase [Legionella jordanis]RMX21134.1 D-alanyl-D-alanine carboxypeptidase/D-alanyl-D-alanine-endopeptidase [Legionella jordanis]
MRYTFFSCILILCLLSPEVKSRSLSEKIDALIDQKLPSSTVGILIQDAITGETIYSKNPQTMFAPASGVKLFTATAALYQLKPDYRFSTSLFQKGDNFYIQFTGSPSFTSEKLKTLLLQLKKNNIHAIKGNIVVDSSRFKAPYHAPGESYDDLGWYYAAPDTAVIINENAIAYDFISSETLGGPVTIKEKSPSNGIKIINELVTVSKEEAKNHCNLNIEVNKNNTLKLFGCYAQQNGAKEMKLAVPNPPLLVKQEIRNILKENQIAFNGHIVNGEIPPDAKLLAKDVSENLSKLVSHMLQESDNVYANSLTKELAYALTKDGSYKQGVFAIKTILSQHSSLDMKQIQLADGVGTRYNLATPKQMVTLLSDIYKDKNIQPILMRALAQAGVSGTLRDRMQKTSLEKNVFAKTGSMHDISSLSGYMIRQNGSPVIFSIMINGINKPLYVAKALEEKILLAVNEEQQDKSSQ